MSDKTSPPMLRTQSVSLRCGLAFVAVTLACLVEFASAGRLEFYPLILLLVAVTISAWLGGLISGLLATFIAAIASTYFLSPTRGDASVFVNLSLFLIEGTLISLAMAALQRANLRLAHVARKEREHLQDALQQLEAQRTEQERTRLYEVVEKAAQEWRMTFDAIESAILIFDFDCHVTRLNKTARTLAGKSYQSLIGTAVEDIGEGVLWSEIAAMVRYVQMSRTVFSTQVRDTKRDKVWEITTSPASDFTKRENIGAGNPMEFDTSSCDASAMNGGKERIIVIARDITSIAELQESLRRSETMSALGSLVAGVAHEVRNPLFGVSATLDALEASLTLKDVEKSTDANYQTYIAVLRGEVERLNGLMRDLLEYGKPLNEGLVAGSVEETIWQAVSACAPLAEKANVTIDVRAGHNAPKVLMERKRLAQVFQNLVENAIHHTPPKGLVTIAIAEEAYMADAGKWIVCEVRDTGAGFKPEDLPRVFEPFFTKRRGGTGLGLSIVQRIVEEHGGTVQALNANGGGAMIIVKLPIVTEMLRVKHDSDERIHALSVENFA